MAAHPLTFDCAVEGGSADAEELGDLESAVLAAVNYSNRVGFLLAVEHGLFAAKPALAVRDLHAFDGAQPDQVRFDYVDKARPSSLPARNAVLGPDEDPQSDGLLVH